MKNLKRIASLVLALALVFSLATTAFAGTITVNGQEGETYTAYKIFDVTYADTDTTKEGYETYSYTISTSSKWYNVVKGYNPATGVKGFTLSASGTTNVDNVKPAEGFSEADAAAFAKYLNDNKPDGATGTEGTIDVSTDADTVGTVSIAVSDAGYYFVTTTLGSLCILNTADADVAVTEKNEVPTVVKEVQEGSKWGATSDGDVGDTVNYKTTITAKKGTTNYVLHDKMDSGLTFTEGSVVVKRTVDGAETELIPDTDYTVTTASDGCTFEIKLTALDNSDKDSTVVVTYNATINSNAVIGKGTNGDGNTNETYLKYGNAGETTHQKTETYVWEFNVFKYVAGTGTTKTPLAGAKFSLYTTSDCSGTPLKFTKVTGQTEVYKLDANGTVTEIATTTENNAGGKFQIEGLDSGTYYLKETEAPAGYNKLAEPVTVVIDAEGSAKKGTVATTDKTIEVENKSGTELPTTGGMGTTLFYVFGGILVVTAVVLLVTKKRVGESK